MAKPIDLTGQRFGMLTVTRQAEKIKRSTAWYCDCDCGTKDFVVLGFDLKNKLVKSCGCRKIEDINLEEKEAKSKAKLKAKEEAKKILEKEKSDWDRLYEYVRSNIMGYDKNQSLSKTMVLRLKGLLTNKFIENKGRKNTANYSYEVILNTFKYSSIDIQNALRLNNFNDEQHKFNYVLKIVEKNINTVYMKMKKIEKANEEAKRTDVSHTVEYVNTFKAKDKKKSNKLDELW